MGEEGGRERKRETTQRGEWERREEGGRECRSERGPRGIGAVAAARKAASRGCTTASGRSGAYAVSRVTDDCPVWRTRSAEADQPLIS